MKLQPKIVLILSAVVVSYAATDSIVQRATLQRQFERMESGFAQKNTVRVKEALEEQLELIDARCFDWAEKPEIRGAIAGEASVGRELSRLIEDADSVDVLCIARPDGSVVWQEAYTGGGTEAPRPLDGVIPLTEGELPPVLMTGDRPEELARGLLVPKRGYLSTSHGPLLVSSRPVRGAGGTTVGKLLVGRILAGELLSEIQARTETLSIRASFLSSADESGRLAEFAERWDGEPLIEADGPDHLTVFHLVDTPLEDEPLVFSARVDREIFRAGKAAVRYSLVSTIAAGMLMLFVLLEVVQRVVLKPIQKLTNNALVLGQDETASVDFDLGRGDEIGTLSSEFDSMMRKLAKSRQALVETAREAGMSEIATGILHNVGNVLNSVNVSANMLDQRARAMAVGDLEALHGIVQEHADDLASFIANDPRGEHLEPFLGAVTEQLRESQQGLTEEVRALNKGIEHIRTLVSSQQDYVRHEDVIEPVDLGEQLDRAYEISETAGGEHLAPVDVVREYADLPEARTARHKLLEVLVNLMQNARQAMNEPGVERRVLTLRTEAAGDDRVRIRVQDSGCGIDPEILVEVFNYGFTTKPAGHGFGLHAAANAATELGGSLSVESEGCGQGAAFTLDIPLRLRAEAVPAAVEPIPEATAS